MKASKKNTDQGADQARQVDQAGQGQAQDAPGRAPGAPAAPGRPDTPPAAPGDQAGRQPRAPGAPRNFQPETRTYAQAVAEAGPDEFVWPVPGPVHGIAGFSKLAGWAGQQHIGGEATPAEIIGDSENALLILISWCKYLGMCKAIQNAPIAEHETFGTFYLRCVEYPGDEGGYLIGVIDAQGACYGAPEWYDELEDAQDAWAEWAEVCAK
jgi:hypothetical protein